MTKTFHSYSENELKFCCTESLSDGYSSDNFFVLAESTDHDCGIKLLKLYTFKNKYDAINYFYSLVKEWQDSFTSFEYRELSREIDNALKSIEKNKTDKDINLDFFNFSTDSLSFFVLEEGYWDNGVHDIIKHIEDVLDIEIDYLEDEVEATEDKKTVELLKSNVDICEILLSSGNTISKAYIYELKTLGESFNDYFDPFK